MANDRITAHVRLPEVQTALSTIVAMVRERGEHACYVYERAPRWYVGFGRRAALELDPTGTRARIRRSTFRSLLSGRMRPGSRR